MRSHDDTGDLPPARDQQAELAMDGAGELRKRPGQFMGDDAFRREASPVKLSDTLDLLRCESRQVAVYLFDDLSFERFTINLFIQYTIRSSRGPRSLPSPTPPWPEAGRYKRKNTTRSA